MANQKIALVTGGNRGIGLEIVKGLAAKGITVLLGCRDISKGNMSASDLKGNIHPVKLDLSTKQSIETDISSISHAFPTVDILVNNAAILIAEPVIELTYEQLAESLHVNTFAPFILSQFFAPRMLKNGYGRIVNISSGWGSSSGLLDSPLAYGVSKSALNDITKILANAFTGNIKINAMCPGWVRTSMGGPDADRSPEQGAETAIWLATLDDHAPSGQFFRDKTAIPW